jgi:hypothetical protein
MKKSELEKYLNDYKDEYKKVNKKSLDEVLKEKISGEDFHCHNCGIDGEVAELDNGKCYNCGSEVWDIG